MKKSFYSYYYIFFVPALIKRPYLLIVDTFVGPRLTIRIPYTHAHLIGTEEYVSQNRGVPWNYRVWEEETKRQIFGLICRGGCLWLFAGS